MVDLLPEYAAAERDDPAKAEVRLVHLLTMSAGLDWDEWLPYSDPRNTLAQMNGSPDWVAFVYNSGGVILIGAVLREATGQDPVAFANEALFGPLGIRNLSWYRNPSHPEQVHTGGWLSLRARDQAKLGS